MDFPLIQVNDSSKSDFKVDKDERFNIMDSRNVQLRDRSFIGYAQLFNSGSQVLSASTNTQLVIDALGTDTYSTQNLWNSVNNKINLADAKVGDYIDCHLFLNPTTGSSFIVSVFVYFDYSPNLDGSKLITYPLTNTTVGRSNYEFNIKFYVTQEMKDNGIGIIVRSNIAMTLSNSKLVLENLPVKTY